jgi:hypothetical protein
MIQIYSILLWLSIASQGKRWVDECNKKIHSPSTIHNFSNPFPLRYNRLNGGGCVPVGALVFKISGRWRRAGCGGFDSHALPLEDDKVKG